jgi:transcriptional regulator with XRE-family HTH domain
MLNNNLFGAFLNEKRLQKDLSLRELAEKANIAHTYLLNIENGNKPPPSDKILMQLEKALTLDEESKILFYDIAAQVKHMGNNSNFYIAADISSYLNDTDDVKQVIREADKLGYSNEFWNEILQKLKEKNMSQM